MVRITKFNNRPAPKPEIPEAPRTPEAVVARLRERIETRVRHGLDEVRLHIDTLSSLLDIAEEMADGPVSEYVLGGYSCRYCGGPECAGTPHHKLHFSHAPDCPYIRARELCGKGDD